MLSAPTAAQSPTSFGAALQDIRLFVGVRPPQYPRDYGHKNANYFPTSGADVLGDNGTECHYFLGNETVVWCEDVS
jgi:hypothetical protein